MMRVITGSARGRRLETLPGEDVTRPTTESVKEALFSMIQFDIEGRRVLDLFAGSGQLGIEALSRGARSCTFVENNRAAKQVVERNLAHCRLEEQANVVFSDAVSFLNRSGTYDLVLLEGFKDSGWPKIEVVRKEISDTPVSFQPLAVVGDIPGADFGLEDAQALADWLVAQMPGL